MRSSLKTLQVLSSRETFWISGWDDLWIETNSSLEGRGSIRKVRSGVDAISNSFGRESVESNFRPLLEYIPATSVSVERVFTKSQHIISRLCEFQVHWREIKMALPGYAALRSRWCRRGRFYCDKNMEIVAKKRVSQKPQCIVHIIQLHKFIQPQSFNLLVRCSKRLLKVKAIRFGW